MECPVCHRESARTVWCECGYDFETGDRRGVMAKARQAREKASHTKFHGFALLASLPLLFVITVPMLGALTALAIAAPLILIGGGWSLAGYARERGATRLLAASNGPAPLPPARVI